MAKRIFFIFLTLFLLGSANAAPKTESKLWTVYNLNKRDNNFIYFIQPQLRFIDRDDKLQQFITNGGIGYFYRQNLIANLGMTWSSADPDLRTLNEHEIRLWEQIDYRKQNRDFYLFSQTRFEQRRLLLFKEWGFRLRQRIRGLTPITHNLSMDAAEEIFINLNQPIWLATKTIDQNRVYLGLEGKLTPDISIGFGYMNQLIFTRPLEINHIVLLSVQSSF